MLLSDRTKVMRSVLAFLAGCAVVGFIMGLRGAMPMGSDPEAEGPLASTPSGVVIEDAIAPPPETLLNQIEEKAEEEAEEDEKKEEDKPAPAADKPKSDAVPPAAPKEEAPPADPVGDLLEPAPATPPPGDLY